MLRRGTDRQAQTLRILMVLRNVFGYTVKNTRAGQHAQHGDQLTKVTRLPHAAGAKRYRQ